jgi:hypothetical protein
LIYNLEVILRNAGKVIFPFFNQKTIKQYNFSYDYLTIHDGNSLLGKYCGDSIPPGHISSTNQALIHFFTNIAETRTGFKIEYHSSSKSAFSRNLDL